VSAVSADRIRVLLAALCLVAISVRAAPVAHIIESSLMPERVYVGGEARLTLRLFRAPGAAHGVLRPPALGAAAEMSLLGPIHTYETEREGVRYEVIERTHVIVPRRAGRMILPGAAFEGVLRYAEVFGPQPGTSPAVRGVARGQQHVLEVKPVPAAAGAPWLPARRMRLEETWSRDLDAISVGTPITRTLVLRAEGLVAERLPVLEMPPHPAYLVHHDQPDLSTEYLAGGMRSQRVQRIVMMPINEAEVALPAMQVHWWDVGLDRPRAATLEGRTLQLRPAIARVAAIREAPADVSVPALLRWLLAAVVLLASTGLWWHLRTRAARAALRNLHAACRSGDARAARDALLAWRRAAMPGRPVGHVRALSAHWGNAEARAQISALDAALYAGRAWDGSAFWHRVRPWLRDDGVGRAAPHASGPALFRLQANGGAIDAGDLSRPRHVT